MVVKNMIKLIFNGYYRSGTTMMYKILKNSNHGIDCFYEPLHPSLFREITKNVATSLHKFYPWDTYNTPCFNSVKETYKFYHGKLKNTGDDIIPLDFKEIKRLFDIFHNLKNDVILQPNRCHFVLKDIAQTYNCKLIHIIRNPVNTWISQTITPPVKNRIWLKRKYQLMNNILGKHGKRYFLTNYLPRNKNIGKFFFGDANYKLVAEKFNRPVSEKNQLNKMLTNWTYFNYHAFTQVNSANGMIVFYEDIVLDPKQWLQKMSEFSNVNFDQSFIKEIKPKISSDEHIKQVFIKKLKKLKLMNMVNAFYPPSKWFGDNST